MISATLSPFFRSCSVFVFAFLMSSTVWASGWQQRVDHTIDVTLDDQQHVLNGHIVTEYVNHSPDTLRHLWIHVWPNAYSDATTALAKQQLRQNNMVLFWALQRDRGHIDSLDFRVGARQADWSFHPEHKDIVKLNLPSPLLPGERLTYETPFRVKLPSGRISRLGHIGQSYQITQWYPKPAVYDADGWHEMPYLNQGEFYSEFGAFDVTIHLPAAYTVGATGDMKPDLADNAAELARLNALSDWTRDQIQSPNPRIPQPGGGEGLKTLRYQQQDVHDFAWFADKTWWVLKDAVTLERSGREVTTWAMFTPDEAEWWQKAPDYLADATRLYSRWVGEYPYNQVTAVDGTISAGGGMEYPNVTVIGRTRSDSGLETVIVHEVGHNWFYGILGSNERANAWMDEGINSYYETRYFEHKYGDALSLTGFGNTPLADKLDLSGMPYRMRDQLAYLLTAQMGVDQPLQCHANDFNDLNYGTIVYKKSAAALKWLEGYLGTQRFDLAMQAYFERWKFKHPQPSDLEEVMSETTYEGLDWFFDEVVGTTQKYDMALRGARVVADSSGQPQLKLRVANRGGLVAPFEVSVRGRGEEQDEWQRLRWLPFEDETGLTTRCRVDLPPGWTADSLDAVRLDGEALTLDIDRTNNTRRTHGLLRGMAPLRLRLGSRLESPDHTSLFWAPVAGWNAADGWMPGLALHNSTLPLRRSEWLLMPMWGVRSEALTGIARWSVRLNDVWRVEGTTQRFSWSTADAVRSMQSRHALTLSGRFNRKPASPTRSGLDLELRDVRNERQWASDEVQPFVLDAGIVRQMISAQGFVETRRGLNTGRLQVAHRIASESSEYLHASTLSHDFRRVRNRDEDSWGFRVFFGHLWAGGESGDAPNLLPLDGVGIGANRDYLADDHYSTRDESATSAASLRVGTLHGGVYGLELATSEGRVRQAALASVRVNWELPFLGAHLYAGAAATMTEQRAADGPEWATTQDAAWAMGLMFPILEGQIEIGLPLWSSTWNGASKYTPWEFATFAFNLRDLSPWHIARDALAGQR